MLEITPKLLNPNTQGDIVLTSPLSISPMIAVLINCLKFSKTEASK